jgi:hypothetical protein
MNRSKMEYLADIIESAITRQTNGRNNEKTLRIDDLHRICEHEKIKIKITCYLAICVTNKIDFHT